MMMGRGGGSSGGGSGNSRMFPFTATQWQELEHQALIYKYMVSGLPIPPDLLFSLRRSFDPSLSSTLLLHQPPNYGWNCVEMGFGRKIDPEPGRCRRTDGKKWRCSKEAYPDSKYCERHMHRGRNRSRKPVEFNSSSSSSSSTTSSPSPSLTPSKTTATTPSPSLFSLSNSRSLSSSTFDAPTTHDLTHSFLHPHPSSSRPPGTDFSSPDGDYRFGCGTKGEADEHPFFSESSSSARGYSVSSSSLAHLKQRTPDLQIGHSFLHLNDSSIQQQKQGQYLHILDSHMEGEMSRRVDGDDGPRKVMHRFFDEMPKDRGSWEDKSQNFMGASTTQLSISTPNSSFDFFMGK